MTLAAFKVFLKRMDKKERLVQDITFQVGNLDMPPYQALRQVGVPDSKIMCTQRRLGHGTGGKIDHQKTPEDRYDQLYQVLQAPDRIYENTKPNNEVLGREFHFAGKKGKDGKIINVVLRFLQGMALQLVTMGLIGDQHEQQGTRHTKVW
jgi:hypothetical protein